MLAGAHASLSGMDLRCSSTSNFVSSAAQMERAVASAFSDIRMELPEAVWKPTTADVVGMLLLVSRCSLGSGL